MEMHVHLHYTLLIANVSEKEWVMGKEHTQCKTRVLKSYPIGYS